MWTLYSYSDRVVLEPEASTSAAGGASTSSSSSASASVAASAASLPIHIDRRTFAITRGPRLTTAATVSPPERIDAVFGLATLLRGKYLIVVTRSSQIGTLHSYAIRQATDFSIVPLVLPSAATRMTKEQEFDEAQYLRLLRTQLKRATLYFSFELDLTLNMQRMAEVRQNPALASQPIYKRADARFFWNRYLMTDLMACGCADDVVVPFVNGYIFQQHLRIQQHEVSFMLFSRRSTQRSGKRFVTRGLDMDGNAANYAENEQVICIFDPTDRHASQILSFVQTRGSVPVLWEQPCTLKYTPKIHIVREGKETEQVFQRHFEVQTRLYGRNVGVNLVNQKGSELALVKAYKAQTDRYDPKLLRLINFDFHHECRNMKYENLSKLIDAVRDEFAAFGYFSARVSMVYPQQLQQLQQQQGQDASATSGATGAAPRRVLHYQVQSVQKGVFRTNCVDCLDRTNVVQSVFAHHVLVAQLQAAIGVNIGKGGTRIDALDRVFKHVWANNADYMSIPYSGTGALKTDYTRTGKRTWKGALKDGVNSVTRYYLNNFQDGDAQDGLDLMLGLHVPSKDKPSPYAHLRAGGRQHPAFQRSVLAFFVRVFLAVLLISMCLTGALPEPYVPWQSWSLSTQLVALVLVVVVVGAQLLLRYGRTYVNKPSFRGGHLP